MTNAVDTAHLRAALEANRARSNKIIEGSRNRLNAMAAVLGGLFTLVGIAAGALITVRKDHLNTACAVLTVCAIVMFFISLTAMVVSLMPNLGALRPSPNVEYLRQKIEAEAARLQAEQGAPAAEDFLEAWSLEQNWWLKERATMVALFTQLAMVAFALGAAAATFI